jgi:hypothetical protein
MTHEHRGANFNARADLHMRRPRAVQLAARASKNEMNGASLVARLKMTDVSK